MSKIALMGATDIALDRLVASDANVRRIKAGISVEELAEDIARRGLLQSLSVRPVLNGDGEETGKFAVSAGGRRLAALKLLVKQKRLAKNAPVPCIVKTEGIEEEDSLAENAMREALHPLDQFRAFKNLQEQGLSIDEIAARFFVGAQVVRQRLKLAAASPKLLDLYVAEELTLEQLMAFCVADDHARQEDVWNALSRCHNKEPYTIRRMLTEGAVKAGDKRAVFVGVEAYEAAGGVVLRDLFQHDQGGWLQDITLLDRLAREKLSKAADDFRAEGWKWSEFTCEFPYGHTNGMRRLPSTPPQISNEEKERYDAALEEYDALSDEHAGSEELPEDIDRRMGELEEIIDAIEQRPAIFDPADMTHGGVFVSIDVNGALKIERGYVRPEDEAPVEQREETNSQHSGSDENGVRSVSTRASTEVGSTGDADIEAEASSKLSDRLRTELSAHRTIALRAKLSADPEAAFLAATHALALNVFYGSAQHSCLDITLRSAQIGSHAPGVGDAPAASSLQQALEQWQLRLPQHPAELWSWLIVQSAEDRAALFAFCIGLGVNALYLPHERRVAAFNHSDHLAEHLVLDMRDFWRPTVENYFGKVTKTQILAAVREAKDEATAQMIDHLKKADMAAEAERQLDGSGWLPEILRTKNFDAPAIEAKHAGIGEESPADSDDGLPAFLAESETEPMISVAAE
ncbi:MAG: ParB/RepB/Spo0J family partition protein [Methylocystis sp.]|jgi:ParB family chromosome partitioning protein